MCGNYKCSVRRDSFFAGSHLSIVEITKIIYYWTYQYPQHIVLHITGKTKKTVVEFYNFCREVCAVILEQQSEPIGITADMEKLLKSMKVSLGKGSITAVSELMESRSSGNWKRQFTAKVLFQTVSDRSAATLIPIIKRWILPGTTILSDCWKAYNLLSANDSLHKKLWTTVCNLCLSQVLTLTISRVDGMLLRS